MHGNCLGLKEAPISLLWGLYVYQNDTWTFGHTSHLSVEKGSTTGHYGVPLKELEVIQSRFRVVVM